MDPRFRAHRHLAQMESYTAAHDCALPIDRATIQCSSVSEVIGVYRNDGDANTSMVLIGTRGILVLSPRSTDIPYDQINDTAIGGPPGFEKHEADKIIVTLKNGTMAEVPVYGGKGRFRDVYQFLSFLRRCQWYLQRTLA